jgi:hypothetical protein
VWPGIDDQRMDYMVETIESVVRELQAVGA